MPHGGGWTRRCPRQTHARACDAGEGFRRTREGRRRAEAGQWRREGKVCRKSSARGSRCLGAERAERIESKPVWGIAPAEQREEASALPWRAAWSWLLFLRQAPIALNYASRIETPSASGISSHEEACRALKRPLAASSARLILTTSLIVSRRNEEVSPRLNVTAMFRPPASRRGQATTERKTVHEPRRASG